MLITNNQVLFHLRLKENLVKHPNVLKYYDHDCRSVSSIVSIHVCTLVIDMYNIYIAQ